MIIPWMMCPNRREVQFEHSLKTKLVVLWALFQLSSEICICFHRSKQSNPLGRRPPTGSKGLSSKFLIVTCSWYFMLSIIIFIMRRSFH